MPVSRLANQGQKGRERVRVRRILRRLIQKQAVLLGFSAHVRTSSGLFRIIPRQRPA